MIHLSRRSTIIAALAATTVLGGAAWGAKQFLFHPFRDFTDREGHIFSAKQGTFSGEVKLYDRHDNYIGSVGSGGTENTTEIHADVTVDGTTYPLDGSGKHELRANGEIIGYATLQPETAAERAEWEVKHNAQLGHDVSWKYSHGAVDGFGLGTGFIGEEGKNILYWRLVGVGEARFTVGGKVVMRGMAFKPAQQPDNPSTPYNPNPPATLRFEWTVNGGSVQQHTGNQPLTLTLPDTKESKGMTVQVKLIPGEPSYPGR